jgi:hypothetical protein
MSSWLGTLVKHRVNFTFTASGLTQQSHISRACNWIPGLNLEINHDHYRPHSFCIFIHHSMEVNRGVTPTEVTGDFIQCNCWCKGEYVAIWCRVVDASNFISRRMGWYGGADVRHLFRHRRKTSALFVCCNKKIPSSKPRPSRFANAIWLALNDGIQTPLCSYKPIH